MFYLYLYSQTEEIRPSFFPKIYISDGGNMDALISFCFSYLLPNNLYKTKS